MPTDAEVGECRKTAVSRLPCLRISGSSTFPVSAVPSIRSNPKKKNRLHLAEQEPICSQDKPVHCLGLVRSYPLALLCPREARYGSKRSFDKNQGELGEGPTRWGRTRGLL